VFYREVLFINSRCCYRVSGRGDDIILISAVLIEWIASDIVRTQ
jgi:hypothetical protein